MLIRYILIILYGAHDLWFAFVLAAIAPPRFWPSHLQVISEGTPGPRWLIFYI